jgi:cytochrome c peroxidase
MHAGQLGSLADVIEFYRHGGGDEGYVGVKDPRIQPLEIDDDEARALEAFLRSLTSEGNLPDYLTRPEID